MGSSGRFRAACITRTWSRVNQCSFAMGHLPPQVVARRMEVAGPAAAFGDTPLAHQGVAVGALKPEHGGRCVVPHDVTAGNGSGGATVSVQFSQSATCSMWRNTS